MSGTPRKFKFNLTMSAAILLGILTVIVIFLQVYFQSDATTKLEATLFNVLQFMLSLAFAFILTKVSLKDEFNRSQKKFAISAFRRINEINFGLERVISRIQQQVKKATKETYHELEVLNALVLSIRGNIKSSIADWADIIGKEIELVQEIESLEGKNEVLLADPETSQEKNESIKGKSGILEKLEENNFQINKLIQMLPSSLKVSTRQNRKKQNSVANLVSSLRKEKEEKGELVLYGYSDDQFRSKIRSVPIGTKLKISIDDYGSRVGVFLVRTLENEPVGVFINTGGGSYHEWTECICDLFGSSKLSAELVEVVKKDDTEKDLYPDHDHFRIKILNEFDDIFKDFNTSNSGQE